MTLLVNTAAARFHCKSAHAGHSRLPSTAARCKLPAGQQQNLTQVQQLQKKHSGYWAAAVRAHTCSQQQHLALPTTPLARVDAPHHSLNSWCWHNQAKGNASEEVETNVFEIVGTGCRSRGGYHIYSHLMHPQFQCTNDPMHKTTGKKAECKSFTSSMGAGTAFIITLEKLSPP